MDSWVSIWIFVVGTGTLGGGIMCRLILKDCGYKAYGPLEGISPTEKKIIRKLREGAIPGILIGIAEIAIGFIIYYL